MKIRHTLALIVFLSVALFSDPALAQFVQQGPKLLATDAVGQASQGNAVSISADGNTALVGGPSDNNGIGAAWVWTRNGGVWTQQSTKLVGSGAGAGFRQAFSVSLSADGNTAIVGGPSGVHDGAAYVWTRSEGVWTQQGKPLIGSGAVGFAGQGTSVSLSADGNTAIVGGYADGGMSSDNHLYFGAAWIWTRSNGIWTQQGSKLIGSGAEGGAEQGSSVALSADGNTAIVGGPSDNNNRGAAWIWSRSGAVWTQQGPKLAGSGAGQGASVALSADGSTAIVGTSQDGPNGPWVWTRSEGVWTQQGIKLVGSGGDGHSQGDSVALSADGNVAVVGGFRDQGLLGAAWVWTRKGGTWNQQGSKLSGLGAAGPTVLQGFSLSVSADGKTVIVGGNGDQSGAGAVWIFTSEPQRRRGISH